MITFETNFGGVEQAIDEMAFAVADLTEPLKAAGAVVRARSQRRIEKQGPGWPGLAPATLERKPSVEMIELLNVIRGKSHRGIKRRGVLSLIDRTLKAAQRVRTAKTEKQKAHWVARARVTGTKLREIARLWQGPLKGGGINALLRLAERDLLQRARKRHGLGRGPRYSASMRSTQVLGGLVPSIRFKVSGRADQVTIRSGASFSGVHNRGGTAGHGAKIPRREFLKVEGQDLRVLANEIEKQAVAALEGTL